MDIIVIIFFAAIVIAGVFLFLRRRNKQKAAQQTNRTKVMATIKRIEERKSTRLVRDEEGARHIDHTTYILVAQAEHPRTRDILTFRSFPFTEQPEAYPIGNEVPVMVNLENPTDYKVETK